MFRIILRKLKFGEDIWGGGGGGGEGFVPYYIPEGGCVPYFFPDRRFYSGHRIIHFIYLRPSLLDDSDWRKILGSKLYGKEGGDLCRAISELAKQLCIHNVEDPESLEALMACRLLPLDKDPGLRPIGIGEVLRRVLGKAVTSVLRGDLQDCAGSQQWCVGQDGGVEANIHGLKAIFQEEETHGVIQVDARNAFNTINRKVLLKNIGIICP